MAISDSIINLLNTEAERINHPDFISHDPVQFPRRFSRKEDIEIVAFLSAMIAWGNRKMICRNMERMLEMMDNEPYAFVMDDGFELIDPEKNLHRTFFGRHLQYYLRGMKSVLKEYGTLDAFVAKEGIGKRELPSWEFAAEIGKRFCAANSNASCSQVVPTNLDQTALKRINMALRWLVRDDGIVDMGIWKSIDKSKLFIPLDVHVGNISRQLGLLERKSNDKRAVLQLTETLRGLRPEDPVWYDYALFGIGVEGGKASLSL